MKNSNLLLSTFTVLGLTLFASCSKNNQNDPSPVAKPSAIVAHTYGLLPMTPDQYANVPRFSDMIGKSKLSLLSTSPIIAPSPFTLPYVPAVRDQGQIGSCTAFCGAETDEMLYYASNPSQYYNPAATVLSPLFIYYVERVILERQSITSDPGANMVNIPQALQKYGTCLESAYAYPAIVNGVEPTPKSSGYKVAPSTALLNAKTFTIGQATTSYVLLDQGNINEVKYALSVNQPVMMGFNVYDNTATYQYFEGLNTTSYSYNPLTNTGALATGCRLLGGHAVPIIGFDDTKQAFLCLNSWGTSWGNAGFFYMPYSVYQSKTIVPAGNVYTASLGTTAVQ